MTNEEHNNYVSWAFIGYASVQVLMIIASIAIFAIAVPMLSPPEAPPPPRQFLLAMAVFVSVYYGALMTPALIAAYAVRKKKSWARFAAIVASLFSVISFPIGTMASVYSMWFFLGDSWRDVYVKDLPATPQELQEFDHAKWEGGFTTDEKGRAVFTPAEPPDWR